MQSLYLKHSRLIISVISLSAKNMPNTKLFKFALPETFLKTNNKTFRYKNCHLASNSATTNYQMAFISHSHSCKPAVDEAEDPSG